MSTVILKILLALGILGHILFLPKAQEVQR